MSGFEVAGLAIALLPLLVSAAEHYEDCISPILRYRTIAKDVHLFQRCLEVQKSIFKNQCRILLEGVVDHDIATRMLAAGSRDPLWRSTTLENKLAESAGNFSKQACVTSIQLISERLEIITEESQRVQALVGTGLVVKRQILKKIIFCLSKSPLEKYITSLRDLNDDFIKICNQMRHTDTLLTDRAKRCPKSHEQECGVTRYTVVREASQKVYQALAKACTKHSEHLALFCFNPEWAPCNHATFLGVKFRIAYTRTPLVAMDGKPTPDQAEPIWFMIDTFKAGAVAFQPNNLQTAEIINAESTNHLLSRSLKRELEGPAPQPIKKSLKSVRFQIPSTSESLELPVRCAIEETSSTPRLRNDFCDVLRRVLRPGHPTTLCSSVSCLGMLENAQNIKHRIYAPPINTHHHECHKVSLNNLITSGTSDSPRSHLSTFDKLYLAKTLAVTVLQYYSTPWLNPSWRSGDIFFLDTTKGKGTKEDLDMSSPHVNVRVRELGDEGHETNTLRPCHGRAESSAITLAPNPLFFSLGVVLLELAYSSTLQNLQKQCDLDNGRETMYTEFFIARRLASTVVREMGRTYGKIVKKLLQCDFGCGDDLEDPELRGVFHRDVVCELERLEEDFRDLKIC